MCISHSDPHQYNCNNTYAPNSLPVPNSVWTLNYPYAVLSGKFAFFSKKILLLHFCKIKRRVHGLIGAPCCTWTLPYHASCQVTINLTTLATWWSFPSNYVNRLLLESPTQSCHSPQCFNLHLMELLNKRQYVVISVMDMVWLGLGTN